MSPARAMSRYIASREPGMAGKRIHTTSNDSHSMRSAATMIRIRSLTTSPT